LQESKTFSLILEDFDKIASLPHLVSSFDKSRLKERSRRSQAFKAGKHDFMWKGSFLSGNVGQTVVQDGRSVDHGISGSPVSYSSTTLV